MERGKFIVLEGGEGAGKGMCMDYLKEWFAGREDVIFTREPGGTPIAEKIRSLLLDKSNVEMFPLTELFLFCAARAQHVDELIKPALESGKNIICDRFEDSTVAYQLYGRQRMEYINIFHILNDIVKAGLKPDAIIYLDVKPEVGLERKAQSKDGHCTRFDEEKMGFHKRVRKGFLAQCLKAVKKKNSTAWFLVSTMEMSEGEVKDRVWEIIEKILK